MIQSGDITIYGARQKFGIPKETMRHHVRGVVEDFHRPGRDFLLTPEEEEAIVQYIGYCCKQNFPLKRQDLRALVMVSQNIESAHIFVS